MILVFKWFKKSWSDGYIKSFIIVQSLKKPDFPLLYAAYLDKKRDKIILKYPTISSLVELIEYWFVNGIL